MKSFDYFQRKNFGKDVPPNDLKRMGLNPETIRVVDTIEELRKEPQNFVIAESQINIGFTQNHFKEQHLKKKAKYVMGLGVYQQLWYNSLAKNKRQQRVLKPSNLKFSKIYRPYRGEDLSDKTLLVTRTGGIGDLLFIQPNLIHLKEIYPDCTIKMACGPQYQAMVDNWDCIDEVLDLPFGFRHLSRADYHAIFEGVIERCREATTENAYRLFTRWLCLNLPDSKLVPSQSPKENQLERAKSFLASNNIDEFVLFQLRASSPIRTPRPSLWANIITKVVELGNKVIITDSPAMFKGVDNLINTLEPNIKENVFNFAQYSKTLDSTIALASLTKCCVSTDSSLIHIAASLKKPAFGLYGPFPGEVRLTTYKNIDWINAKCDCAPCYQHGPNPCKNSKEQHSICYDNLDIEEIINRIKKIY